MSVVVPTRNGGAGLAALVESLLAQTHCRLEILLLDSGSTDGSSDLVHRSPLVRWVPIPPASFSHSATRNRGVELARYPLVFLTVQDAVLTGENDLRKLCDLLTAHDLGVLSVAETPREDADAYARYSLDSYYSGMYPGPPRTLVHSQWQGTRRERVVAASVGNVASLYRRDALVGRPFRGVFGEDFDWAVRALQEGVRVGKTSEVHVVHSHTRPAFHACQRMFLSHRLMATHGVGEPVPGLDEAGLVAVLESAAGLFSDDEAMKLLLKDLGAVGRPGPLDPLLAAAVVEGRPWEPTDETERALFLQKVVAGRLGWLIGAAAPEAFSEARRPVIARLGQGV